MIDERVKEWATPRQIEVIDAVNLYGSERKAAKALGCCRSAVHKSIAAAIKKSARAGWAPDYDMMRVVPPGYLVKGVSTYYDNDGKPRGQWVKSRIEEDSRLEILREAIEAAADTVRGKAADIIAPIRTYDHVLTVYPLGDPHIGMYAWAQECGDDFDCDIARENLCAAMARMVACAPSSETALIVSLGDFFHADSLTNTTLRSGNPLDVDTRWPKVLELGVLALRECIELALIKHRRVEVVCAIGNHDDHSSVMLSLCLAAFYEQIDRVHVYPTHSKYHYIEFGRNLIGITHGDTLKMTDLGAVMATDRAEAWGRTRHRYWYTGHIHHRRVLEHHGCVIESFRTLAAKDAYHAAHGYRAGRDMVCIVLDRDHGEIERHRVDIAMLQNKTT